MMAEQADFFAAFARHSDPATSKEAAASVIVHLPALEGSVLHCIRGSAKIGMTIDELVEELKLDKVTLSPRLRPLVRKGLIQESGFTRPGRSGREQTVWTAVT
jgi:predicted transcriptional regulator